MDKLTKYTQVEHLQKTNELVDKVNELKPVATSGSYNDLTDTPVLDNDAIIEALGYTPLNADEGGTVNGDVNVTGKYLVNGEELESGINLLKRSKEYAAGNIAFSKDLKSPYHLKCIVAGTTAETEPEGLSSKLLNDEFEDGTVKWKVTEYVNHLENYLFVGSKEDLAEDKLHENMIVVDPEELINPLDNMAMVGATEELDGMSGLVPAPEKGTSNRYLSSDGTWKEISAPEVDLSNVAKLNETNNFTKMNVISNSSESVSSQGIYSYSSIMLNQRDYENDFFNSLSLGPHVLVLQNQKNPSSDGNFFSIKITPGIKYEDRKPGILKFISSTKSTGESLFNDKEISLDIFNKTIDVTSDAAVNDSDGNPINTTYVKNNQIGNEANKLVQYTSDGHIMLPTGIEIY